MAVRNQSDRINFGKLREVIVPPNLIEIQITSYLDFLQKGIPDKQRKPQGLEASSSNTFPTPSVIPKTPSSSASRKASPTRCPST
jgi:DNA-directed RNA polymerase subunit beta